MRLDSHTVRQVAVDAACDPRTVLRFLAGRPVYSTTKARIEHALRRLDVQHRGNEASDKPVEGRL